MEFSEKLQQLRKQKGLTQEELATTLFVSRTAVSKWEQGKGYPSIESLKAISVIFGVSVDELLKSEEILLIADTTAKQKENLLLDITFSLIDISSLLLIFLPLFATRLNVKVHSASLLHLGGSPYLKTAFLGLIILTALFGILRLCLQNSASLLWQRVKNPLSLILSAVTLFTFTLCLHPYAATLVLIFFIIKVLLTLKVSQRE